MLRLYLRLTLLPLIIFTIVLLLIHAQPYDDHNLKSWVMPDDCSAPCIMGIQPGVTTLLDTVQILRQNDWVSRVTPLSNEQNPTQVWWLWSDKAPDYLLKGGRFSDGQIIGATGNKVGFISFDTTLVAGDILLMLGKPDEDAVMFAAPIVIPPDPQMWMSFELWYMPHHLWATGSKLCPYYTDFWHTPVHFNVTDVDGKQRGSEHDEWQ